MHSIWSLDVANHGHLYLLNVSEIGDEPHWFDTAYDVAHLIHTFHADLAAPLIGNMVWVLVAQATACYEY